MTIKLDLAPDVFAWLEAEAHARGLDLESYAEQILRERSSATALPLVDAAEKARAFRLWAESHRRMPPLSHDALRRENLVRDPWGASSSTPRSERQRTS